MPSPPLQESPTNLCLPSLIHSFFISPLISSPFLLITNKLPNKPENMATHDHDEVSILDLPELALDIILEKLPPASLTNMASVCTSFRERCTGDYLWDRHMQEKWGSIVGDSALKEWQQYRSNLVLASKERNLKEKSTWIASLACSWPICWMKSLLDSGDGNKVIMSRNVYRQEMMSSVMSYYGALESGKFWFPAQVFNRENGHVGFVLSCYDAHLSYDRQTNTFFARYPPHGTKPVKTEEGVQWDRVRAPLVSTPSHDLHISDCLKELCPGDHFEIQWRKNKEFPYGWWYGVVGHLETCHETQHFCRCQEDDDVVLEFKQYSRGSRWRRMVISRKDHREKGDETDGFYGGIRKLKTDEEIKMWRRFWPVDVLE